MCDFCWLVFLVFWSVSFSFFFAFLLECDSLFGAENVRTLICAAKATVLRYLLIIVAFD